LKNAELYHDMKDRAGEFGFGAKVTVVDLFPIFDLVLKSALLEGELRSDGRLTLDSEDEGGSQSGFQDLVGEFRVADRPG
jgi:hypothetical protein